MLPERINRLLRYARPNENLTVTFARVRSRLPKGATKPDFYAHVVDPSKPARHVIGGNCLRAIHWKEKRYMTVQELSDLSGFNMKKGNQSMKKPIALGANIFAGGFTLGVSQHFRVIGHLEHDDYGAAVAHQNLNVPIYTNIDEWPKKLPHKLDWLYANPPCAIWSLAAARRVGSGYTWKNDPRLQRIRDIFALVDRYHPTVWTWESVCQAFQKGREFVEEIADMAEKRGYSTSYVLVDAMYLNTPQTRKRFFLVLHKVAIDWEKAKPAFGKVITAGQALRHVKPEKGHSTDISKHSCELRVIKHTKPGMRLQDAYDKMFPRPKLGTRGQKLGRPSFLKRRLHPDRVSGVVIGETLFHPTEHRYLAVNEAAALCGFPRTWKWPKKRSSYDLLARGVMPPVGEWLARHVAAAIRLKRVIRKPTRQLVDFRLPPGSIRDVGNLPAGVDLDWKPGSLKVPSEGRKQGKVRLAGKGSGRAIQPLNQLAEATRKGIPTKAEGSLIRIALKELQRGRAPETSGMLIRARIIEGKKADHDIVQEVLRKFEGRKTTIADVSYHKGKLRRAGMIV